MRFHTFIVEDICEELMEDHKKVCSYLDIEVVYHTAPPTPDYHEAYTLHGQMMTQLMVEEKDEVVCFLDADCLPWNTTVLQRSYNYALDQKSFIGNAQNISHQRMKNRLYAAASTLFVSKDGWEKLDKPDLGWFVYGDVQVDTAQILSLRADDIGFEYKLLYPIGSEELRWPLGNYGYYGIGTVYPGSYHYFQLGRPRTEPLPQPWKNAVQTILDGKLLIPKESSMRWLYP